MKNLEGFELRAFISEKDSSTAWNLWGYILEGLVKFIQKNYPESLPKTRVLIENKDILS